MTISSRADIWVHEFIENSRKALKDFLEAGEGGKSGINEARQEILHALEDSCVRVEPPMQRLERIIHPWVTYLIMPVFALANAGVHLNLNWLDLASQPVSLGIVLGLVLGKQIGITLFTWLSVCLKIAELPEGVRLKDIYGVIGSQGLASQCLSSLQGWRSRIRTFCRWLK